MRFFLFPTLFSALDQAILSMLNNNLEEACPVSIYTSRNAYIRWTQGLPLPGARGA